MKKLCLISAILSVIMLGFGLTACAPTYFVQYVAGEGGKIQGETDQIIKPNGSTSRVVAVPDEGYTFVQWSDDVITPSRTDSDINADMTLTAIFEPKMFTVTYTASQGGYIDGESVQIIIYNEDAETVVAVPESGYYFAGWSDDEKLPATRQDKNVKADITVTAKFVKV